MILSAHDQAELFLLTILLGGLMGLLYDGLRLFRRILPHKRFWIQTEDFLYWIILALAVFSVLLHKNAGEIRFFIFLGLGGGLLLYFLVCSPFIMRVGEGVLYGAKKVIVLFFTILFTPFRLVFSVFRRPMQKMKRFCEQHSKNCLHLCKVYVKIKMGSVRRGWRMLRKK